MPSFLYPRTITITRVEIVKTIADGLHEQEVVVAAGLDASIQMKRARPVGPPIKMGPTQSADAQPEWIILFAGPSTLVRKSDKITDELGATYQVEAPYWNSMGWNVTARNYNP
jgi:hypothetical protein